MYSLDGITKKKGVKLKSGSIGYFVGNPTKKKKIQIRLSEVSKSPNHSCQVFLGTQGEGIT